MNCAGWNCEGIRSKLPSIHDYFSSHNLHALLLFETWLTSTDLLNSPLLQQHLPGEFGPRSRRANGGISLLTRPDISSTLLARSPSAAWGLWFINDSYLVAGVYLRPSLSPTQVAAELQLLTQALDQFDRLLTIVIGDFNTHLGGVVTSCDHRRTLRNCPRAELLTAFAANSRFHIHNLDHHPMIPTNVSVTSRGVPFATTVDYCLTRDAQPVAFHIDEPPARTPHRVLRVRITAPDSHTQPDFPGLGGRRYNWNRRTLHRNSAIHDILKAIYSPAISMLRDFWHDFLPNELSSAADPTVELNDAYNWSCNWLIETGRGIAGGTPPRKNPRLRRFLRSWNAGPTHPTQPPDLRNTAAWQPAVGSMPPPGMLSNAKRKLQNLRNTTTNYADMPTATEFHDLFTDLYTGRYTPSDPVPAAPPPVLDPSTFANPFSTEASLLDLEKDISSMRKGKAVGLDQIPVALLATDPLANASLLRSMFQLFFQWSTTPLLWRTAPVALLFKKGDPRDASNYRPIALVSHPRKLYERAIRRAISVHPAFSFHPLQCGFLPSVGAIDAANLAAEALHITSLARAPPAAILLDIQKAYDSVCRQFLWTELLQTGLPAKLVDVVRSLFDNTLVTLRYQNRHLPQIPLQVGLLQGAVLSTSLFNKYIDPLLHTLSAERTASTVLNGIALPFVAFADDITLLGTAQPSCIARFAVQLQLCETFATRRGFRFNASKCVCTSAFSSLPALADLTIHGDPIHGNETVDILGCKFSAGLFDPDSHLAAMIQRTQSATNLLAFSGLFRSDVCLYRKAILAKSFARSHLEYGLQLIPPTAPRLEALNSTLRSIAAATLAARRGTAAQLRALGFDCYSSRLPSLIIRRFRRLRLQRLSGPAVLRLLADRVLRNSSFTAQILPRIHTATLTQLLELDQRILRTRDQDETARLHESALRLSDSIVAKPWLRLARSHRTVRELTNDPRRTHWSLKLSDPKTNHLWARFLCGIWVPGHPPCTRCPPAPTGNRWPLTRQHLMHCTDSIAALQPLVDALLATAFVPAIADKHYNLHSALPTLLPDDAPFLSRLASITPNRLHWASSTTYILCPASHDLTAALRIELLKMQAIIDEMCGPPPAPNGRRTAIPPSPHRT